MTRQRLSSLSEISLSDRKARSFCQTLPTWMG